LLEQQRHNWNQLFILPLCCWQLQDKKVKAKVDARNKLETYVYNMKSTIEDKMKDKIDEDDREKVSSALKEAQEWLDENSDAGGLGKAQRQPVSPSWFSLLQTA
jgi:molecular chaperone DnaK (HSP70)